MLSVFAFSIFLLTSSAHASCSAEVFPTTFSTVQDLSNATEEVVAALGDIDPAKVIKESQDFINKWYGKEKKMDIDDADKWLDKLQEAYDYEKTTPAQKLSILLNQSKMNNLGFKNKGKLWGMSYGKRSFSFLKKAVKLDPKSPEAARVYGEGVAGMVEADSPWAIENAIGVRLADEARAALKLLEDNGLNKAESYKTISEWLPKLEAREKEKNKKK